MRNNSTTTFDISSSTLLRIVAFVLGLWFLWIIRDILLILLVSVFIASALEPLASRLQRFRVPRAISVLVAYILFVAIIVGIGTLIVPPLVTETQNLAQDLPNIYERYSSFLGRAGTLFGGETALSSLQQGLLDVNQFLAKTTGGFFATTRTVFDGVFAVVLVFVISFYLVISRENLYAFIRSVVPVEHQPYTIDLIKRVQQKIGRWLVAQLVLGVLVGVLVFVVLWILKVPYALALALLAFFGEFIPFIGPTIAAIPAVLLGFTQSFVVGIMVIVVYLIIQQLEAHVLVPTIMRKAIGLNPLTTILAILIGAKLAGFVGVLIAVPVATIIIAFLGDLIPANKEEEIPA